MDIGIITYNTPHLKTEQIVLGLLNRYPSCRITMYALPFVARKKRHISYPHRPDQTQSIDIHDLANIMKLELKPWDGKQMIEHNHDVVLITGAGIIDPTLFGDVPIVNTHPGIIPLVRGLDAFKWSIYHQHPLGVTLHLIDQEVDKGKILTIEKTPVFSSDSYETLARRHYQIELELMLNFPNYLQNNYISSYNEQPANMRMPADKEKIMIDRFDEWKATIS
jgi:phosphoribosylglycinamide formyltransferase 1